MNQDFIQKLVREARYRSDCLGEFVTDAELSAVISRSLTDLVTVAVLDAGIYSERKQDMSGRSMIEERKAFLLSRATQMDGVK